MKDEDASVFITLISVPRILKCGHLGVQEHVHLCISTCTLKIGVQETLICLNCVPRFHCILCVV